MNETYNTGSFDYTILKVYSTISKSFATELVDEEYIQPVMNQLNLYRGIYDENVHPMHSRDLLLPASC